MDRLLIPRGLRREANSFQTISMWRPQWVKPRPALAWKERINQGGKEVVRREGPCYRREHSDSASRRRNPGGQEETPKPKVAALANLITNRWKGGNTPAGLWNNLHMTKKFPNCINATQCDDATRAGARALLVHKTLLVLKIASQYA